MSYFDVPAAANVNFPSHGWLTGCNGVKFLRFPILRMYQHGQVSHQRFVEHQLAGMWLQFRSPYRTIRQLAIVLRDIHRLTTEMLALSDEDWRSRGASSERDLALDRKAECNEEIEVLLIAAFFLLRRLADDLIRASGPLLFQHWKSVPTKMMDMVSAAEKGS
jgi:hypothetical protein